VVYYLWWQFTKKIQPCFRPSIIWIVLTGGDVVLSQYEVGSRRENGETGSRRRRMEEAKGVYVS
jgi:hypothetical protein